jgi:hypothetical protein
MRRLKRFIVAGVAAAALTFGLPTPAFAVEHVNCGNRANLEIIAVFETRCFAGKGEREVNIVHVLDFSTGNNRVVFYYTDNLGRAHELTVQPNQRLSSMPGRERVPQLSYLRRIKIY